MSREFTARLGFISLTTSSFYGPVNFGTGSSIVGLSTGSVLFTNASGSITGSSNLFWDNTNRRLGIGTSSPATTLDVRGSISTAQAILPSFAASGSAIFSGINVGASSGVYVGVQIPYVAGGYGGHSIGYSNQSAPKWLIGISRNITEENALVYYEDSSAANPRLTIFPGGNINLGSIVNSNYRLDINGSSATAGALRVSGSTTATAGAGSAISFTPTLVASANNDTLVGLDVNPTFTNGAFTGVTNYALRVKGLAATAVIDTTGIGGSSTLLLNPGSSNANIQAGTLSAVLNLNTLNVTTPIDILIGGQRSARFAATTRNFLVNTATDSNYKINIDGTGAASGSLQISGSNTQPTIVGNSLTSVNIAPTMIYTTGSQTQTALKVLATFSGSSAFTSSQSNIIADFGATSVGSQLIVTDVTSGSIYMVNDVSGIPIIDADSNWSVNFYDYPYTVFKKTGSMLELGVQNQTSSYTLFKSDLIVNEGLGFYQRTSQVSGSTNGAVTSSLYSINFTNTSASVYLSAVVTGYDTGSRDTISGDIKATIRYRSGVASVVGYNQSFYNTDNSVVGFDIIAGGTSGSLVAYGTGSRVYQFGATVNVQVI